MSPQKSKPMHCFCTGFVYLCSGLIQKVMAKNLLNRETFNLNFIFFRCAPIRRTSLVSLLPIPIVLILSLESFAFW